MTGDPNRRTQPCEGLQKAFQREEISRRETLRCSRSRQKGRESEAREEGLLKKVS